jgi:hypothetical protein
MAAVLFPPRLLKSFRRGRGEAFFTFVVRAIRSYGKDFSSDVRNQWLRVLLVLLSPGLLLFATFAFLFVTQAEKVAGLEMVVSLGLGLGGTIALGLVPFALALLLMGLLYGALALCSGFGAEIEALARADDGASVLGRIRQGLGRK